MFIFKVNTTPKNDGSSIAPDTDPPSVSDQSISTFLSSSSMRDTGTMLSASSGWAWQQKLFRLRLPR